MENLRICSMRYKLGVSAASTTPVTREQAKRCHRITPEAGHALEMFGHAIEYLTDELVDKSTSLSANKECVQAIQILSFRPDEEVPLNSYIPRSQNRDRGHPSVVQNQAVRALVALNRQVYLECPLVPTLGEWLRAHFLRFSLHADSAPDRDCPSDIPAI
jgi:hypothetical protein